MLIGQLILSPVLHIILIMFIMKNIIIENKNSTHILTAYYTICI